MALGALGIDIMLPGLGAIRSELGLAPDATAVSGLVTSYLVGMAFGSLFFGPLSDRFGRKPTLFIGFAIYFVGAAAATFGVSLTLLLASRFVWGFGSAGARVVAIAAIRDTHTGEEMSRAMSFIMAVFVLVPIGAPLLGGGILTVASWRWIFGVCVAAVVLMALWATRLPETHAPQHRMELSLRRVGIAARFIIHDRQAVGYTIAMTMLYGAFLSYLASSELIVSDAFGRRALFPVVFASLAAVMGSAMLANARLVRAFGTARVAVITMRIYVVLAVGLVLVALAYSQRPPFWLFLVGTGAVLVTHAILIPNFNALAMTNMAPVAGTAASVIAATHVALGAGLGAIVDRAYQGTVMPLWVGFAGYGIVALIVSRATGKIHSVSARS